jgi:hypothetical protein
VPTKRPRYMVTDTGPVADMLDRAQRAWPEMTDRKALLVRLAEAGSRSLAREAEEREAAARGERQRDALRRVAELVDAEALLADEPWR